jgi:hypothetical protein
MKKKKGCELPKHLLLSTSIHSEILDNRQKKKEKGDICSVFGGRCACARAEVAAIFLFFFLLILKEFRQPSENAPGMFIYSLLL